MGIKEMMVGAGITTTLGYFAICSFFYFDMFCDGIFVSYIYSCIYIYIYIIYIYICLYLDKYL